VECREQQNVIMNNFFLFSCLKEKLREMLYK
jgi:hypothetical protein